MAGIRSVVAVLCMTAWLGGGPAFAQTAGRDFPSRPITLIVPYAPGNTDIIARIYLTQMALDTGWSFTYDYKPGASGVIGAAAAAKAPLSP